MSRSGSKCVGTHRISKEHARKPARMFLGNPLKHRQRHRTGFQYIVEMLHVEAIALAFSGARSRAAWPIL